MLFYGWGRSLAIYMNGKSSGVRQPAVHQSVPMPIERVVHRIFKRLMMVAVALGRGDGEEAGGRREEESRYYL